MDDLIFQMENILINNQHSLTSMAVEIATPHSNLQCKFTISIKSMVYSGRQIFKSLYVEIDHANEEVKIIEENKKKTKNKPLTIFYIKKYSK